MTQTPTGLGAFPYSTQHYPNSDFQQPVQPGRNLQQ